MLNGGGGGGGGKRRGVACILAKRFWPNVMSLSLLIYGSPEASCNK